MQTERHEECFFPLCKVRGLRFSEYICRQITTPNNIMSKQPIKLAELIEAYKSKGEKSFEEFIDEQIKKYQMSETKQKLLKESFQVLEEIEESSKSLQEAKEKGVRRENWLWQQMTESLQNENLPQHAVDGVLETITKISEATVTLGANAEALEQETAQVEKAREEANEMEETETELA